MNQVAKGIPSVVVLVDLMNDTWWTGNSIIHQIVTVTRKTVGTPYLHIYL